jgi:hypothetical protein
LVDKHFEVYDELPYNGIPYHDDFLTDTVHYGWPSLHNDHPDYFGLAVEWLHTKKLASPHNSVPGPESPNSWHCCPTKMYALAHKLGDKKLLSAIMDQSIESDSLHKVFLMWRSSMRFTLLFLLAHRLDSMFLGPCIGLPDREAKIVTGNLKTCGP